MDAGASAELDVAVDDAQRDVVAVGEVARDPVGDETERWRPPVQPIAIVRWVLPSAT